MSNTTTLTSLSVVVAQMAARRSSALALTALLEKQDSPIGEIIVPYAVQEVAYQRLAHEFPTVVFTPVPFTPNWDQSSSPKLEYAARHVVYDTLKAHALSLCQVRWWR